MLKISNDFSVSDLLDQNRLKGPPQKPQGQGAGEHRSG